METKRHLITLLGFALCASLVHADDQSALKTEKEKVSYGIGMNIGSNLKRQSYDVEVDLIAKGIKDVLSSNTTLLTEQQAQEAIMSYQKELRAKQEEKNKQLAEKNKKAGEDFLAANAKKPGVVTLPSGLQYKVITEGTGDVPKNGDTVTVNYKGTLIDGTEFDSSYKRGQPATFNVNGVIKGWTEALLMMKTGSKQELYIPASLAYGDRGQGAKIEPGSTLIFEVELVSTKSPQPTTSDIIKVPSAEELKAGAKIEVIKPEDVNKAKAEEAKPAKPEDAKPK
ncbi:MAG: FKBP-type peptidyl-prolyl cis-trans isomerase [Verrucomicrobia bacterium]|nr:FKBP-type peptidyl-prolyl cis-trans isomerase [Verrucomicrobiota bacterium]